MSIELTLNCMKVARVSKFTQTAVVSSGKANHDVDCSKGDGFSCHTCLGRDYSNCNSGQTCCKTACFKMIDDSRFHLLLEQQIRTPPHFPEHSLIAKGCWSKKVDTITRNPEHESARTFTTNVELPWVADEEDKTITGESPSL